MPTLDEAINVIRMGDRERGRELLEEILEVDEGNEEVWLWLSSVVDTDEDREICLENVLALNPDNIVAQKGLEALRQGTFNVHNIIEEALEETDEDIFEEDEDLTGATFLDEFSRADDEEDEELELPSTMKPKKKGGLNIRFLLIVVLILCVVLALGGAAAYNLFIDTGDGGTPTEQPPAQATPAEGQQPETTATDTPVADTPTPTNTPFTLPTPEPTTPPTPTSTPVVSPTTPR